MTSEPLSPRSRKIPLALCSYCQDIPFGKLFYGPYSPENRTTGADLGSLRRVLVERVCVWCILVRQVLRTFYGEDILAERLKKGYYENVILYRTPVDINFDVFDLSTKAEVACYLEIGFWTPEELLGKQPIIERKERFTNDGFDRSWVSPSLFSINPSAGSDSHAQPGRFVDPDWIDWSVIRHWTSTCSAHGTETAENLQPHVEGDYSSSHLRAIDVERACVVPFPQGAPYIALSYQWGSDQKMKLKKENLELLETAGFFNTPEGKPAQTIWDAMTVVRQLGYRYAWIDALCIVQDDIESINLNVDSMDQVYHNAHITIVAAAGANAYHGLPGVSAATPRTEVQFRIRTDDVPSGQDLWVANMLENANGAINSTRWNTRGWTYQERLLSRRLLTFTESQVFYHCDWGCDCQEQYHDSGGKLQYTLSDPRARLDLENRNIWETYAIAVAEYSKRSITDPMDKLRAMYGVLNYLKKPFRGPFHYGLPTTLFDVGLLWRPMGPHSRGNPMFPSWSWAGWDGSIVYELVDSMNNMCECIISQVDISPQTTQVRLCSNLQTSAEVRSTHDALTWQRKFDEETLEIEYESTEAACAQLRYPRPLVPRVHDERLLSQGGAKILNIIGKTVSFLLTDEHSFQIDPILRMKSGCREGVHELCYLAILDDQQRIAGTIMVDGRIVPQISNKKHRFLALSRSTLYRIDEDPSWDEETKTFRHWSQQQPRSVPEIDPTIYANSHAFRDDMEANDDFFDKRHYSDQVWWPAMNVLLLSEEKDGVVERLGIGKIHVHAFEPVAKTEEILLG